MSEDAPFLIHRALDRPIAAAAVHDGAALRPEVARAIALSEPERRREEDPFTGTWTTIVGTRLLARRSRFEVDLNRPRDGAVYRRPEDAWGLDVWRRSPDEDMIARSLAIHDAFYREAEATFAAMRDRWGRFVVLDLHSYNHRRGGPDAPPDDPAANPEINIGTGSLPAAPWRPLVDRFLDELREAKVHGRRLDVRENVRFRGGYFSQWVHSTFPGAGCALAIEVRKFFMDEWTGVPDPAQLDAVRTLLADTLPGLCEELERLS